MQRQRKYVLICPNTFCLSVFGGFFSYFVDSVFAWWCNSLCSYAFFYKLWCWSSYCWLCWYWVVWCCMQFNGTCLCLCKSRLFSLNFIITVLLWVFAVVKVRVLSPHPCSDFSAPPAAVWVHVPCLCCAKLYAQNMPKLLKFVEKYAKFVFLPDCKPHPHSPPLWSLQHVPAEVEVIWISVSLLS